MKKSIIELNSKELEMISGGLSFENDILKPAVGAVLIIGWHVVIGVVAWQLGKSAKPHKI
jgi:hypothetical protein